MLQRHETEMDILRLLKEAPACACDTSVHVGVYVINE